MLLKSQLCLLVLQCVTRRLVKNVSVLIGRKEHIFITVLITDLYYGAAKLSSRRLKTFQAKLADFRKNHLAVGVKLVSYNLVDFFDILCL